VVVRYHAERIVAHLSSSQGVHLLHQPEPATLGSALATAAQAVQGRCLILHGDNYFSALPAAAFRAASPHASTFFLESLPGGQPDAATLAATGCYLLESAALRQIASLPEVDDLAAVVSALLDAGRVVQAETLGGWRRNVNSIQDYLALQERVWAMPSCLPALPAADVSRTVWVSPTARVEDSRLGPRVCVGPAATVRRSDLADAVVLAAASVEGVRLRRAVIGPGPDNCTVLMFGGERG
jgi:NDP-sugar pyrophosphorylase family protein